jgi:mannose-1-phosphate guanylyltransferase
MIGFILAAGFGTRLKPLTEHVPKAMVSVCGIPLLERNLVFFKEQGVENLGVNVHYLPEQVYSFRESSPVDFDIFHEKDKIRGTGGALYFARDFLGSDDLFCIANADIISNVDVQKLAEEFLKAECIIGLVGAPAIGKGTILYNRESNEYGGPQSKGNQSQNNEAADFIGMAFYKKKALDFVRRDDFSVLPVWERSQEHGFSVKVLMQNDIFWRDTGTPYALAKIHFDVLDGTVELNIPENITVDYKKKIAFPSVLPYKSLSALGSWSWADSDNIAETAHINNCVIYRGAVVKEGESLSNVILTQWGGIPFEK